MNYDIISGQLESNFIQLLQPWNAFENSQAGVYDGDAMGYIDRSMTLRAQQEQNFLLL